MNHDMAMGPKAEKITMIIF